MFRSADDSTIAMGPYSEAIVVFIMHLGLHFVTMIIWALEGPKTEMDVINVRIYLIFLNKNAHRY